MTGEQKHPAGMAVPGLPAAAGGNRRPPSGVKPTASPMNTPTSGRFMICASQCSHHSEPTARSMRGRPHPWGQSVHQHVWKWSDCQQALSRGVVKRRSAGKHCHLYDHHHLRQLDSPQTPTTHRARRILTLHAPRPSRNGGLCSWRLPWQASRWAKRSRHVDEVTKTR